jgi:hypothetical protein
LHSTKWSDAEKKKARNGTPEKKIDSGFSGKRRKLIPSF